MKNIFLTQKNKKTNKTILFSTISLKRIFVVLSLVLLTSGLLNAQRKIDVSLGFGYSLAFKGEGYGKALQLQGLYRVTEALKVGLGAKSERLELPGVNTLPVFAAAEWNLPFLRRAFVYGDVGYGFPSSQMIQGAVADAGVGYFLPFGRNRQNGMQFKLGYNLKAMSYEELKYTRHSFVMGAYYVF